MYRIGIGYDIHRLVEERKLFIGGVEIPYYKGLLGHSDADVLLHAISDALLGAVGEEDIGEKFPDNAPEYLDAKSSELLKRSFNCVRKKGFSIVNIDAVVIAEEPKISPFKKKMAANIAEALEISPERINIKAKTNEALAELGRGEAIASYAVVLLNRGD